MLSLLKQEGIVMAFPIGSVLSELLASLREAFKPTSKGPDLAKEWTAILEWAETNGIENLKARHVTADTIAKEAATTLTVLIAGLGSSLAYGVKVFEPEPPGPIAAGAAILCVYLTLLGLLLVWKCMLIAPIPSVYQEPENLVQEGEELDRLRKVELQNLQIRINETVSRNRRVATWMNRVRLAALASPLVFGVAALTIGRHPVQQRPAVLFQLECKLADGTASAPASISCRGKQ